MSAAAGAYPIGKQLSVRERQPEKPPLPHRRSHYAAQLLIRVIIDAERIAMRQQYRLAGYLGNHRVRQQLTAGLQAEVLTDEEVPVAVHQEAGDSAGRQCAQRGEHLGSVAAEIIITD